MKLARFVNYTDDIFAHPSLGGHDDICQWGREPYCFPPKSSKVMEDWKAAFFAKHLTNRELLKTPMGEYHTSPKDPQQDAYFMEIYNKCYLPEESVDMSQEKMKDALIEQVVKEEPKEEAKPTIFCEFCDSKGVRHKKDCPTLKQDKKPVESSFEGLDK